MNAKDYRIGNYLHDNKTGAILIVDEIPKENDKTVLGLLVVDRSKYPLPPGWQAEPITITAKMLVNCCSFKEIDKGPYSDQPAVSYGVESVEIIWSGGSVWKRTKHVSGDIEKVIVDGFKRVGTAEYLHQLQNAWPFLFQTELKVKL